MNYIVWGIRRGDSSLTNWIIRARTVEFALEMAELANDAVWAIRVGDDVLLTEEGLRNMQTYVGRGEQGSNTFGVDGEFRNVAGQLVEFVI